MIHTMGHSAVILVGPSRCQCADTAGELEVYITEGELSFSEAVIPKLIKMFRKLTLSLKNKNKEKEGARVNGTSREVNGVNGVNGTTGLKKVGLDWKHIMKLLRSSQTTPRTVLRSKATSHNSRISSMLPSAHCRTRPAMALTSRKSSSTQDFGQI